MEIVPGYNIPTFKCTLVNEEMLRSNLDNYGIRKITLDANIIIPSKNRIVAMCDSEQPMSFVDNAFFWKSLCLDKKYVEDHLNEVSKLVVYICKNSKESSITIENSLLITDEIIEAIISNSNIKTVSLGYEDDIFVLTEDIYNKFKGSGIEVVKTGAVEESLKENFDKLIGYNVNRNLVANYNYDELTTANMIILNSTLNDEEIANLKYVNVNANVIFKSTDYFSTFKSINTLRKLGHVGKIEIDIENKNALNNYLFAYVNELQYFDNIEVNLIGKITPLRDYLKYEKKLFELIAPAIDYSPFEKYLYAYNVVKHFKEYKENDEDKQSARNIYSILDNDYMVCVGYANLLGDLLDKLGIESSSYGVTVETGLDGIPNEDKPLPDFVYDEKNGQLKELGPDPGGHARRMIHLIDPKYDIDGYYFADPTWDNDMEHDTYNFALMTQEEYIGLDRYDYYKTNSVDELFFVKSLEEFYLKINIYLDKNRTRNELDVVRGLFYAFKELDFEFYEFLKNKYGDVNSYSTKFTKDEILNILLDVGEKIVQKSNNVVIGQTFKEGITTLYSHFISEPSELEREVKETMEYNKERHAKCFPMRYKVDGNDNKMVVLNLYNKFDLEEQPKLGV